jgi:hypothetical protein
MKTLCLIFGAMILTGAAYAAPVGTTSQQPTFTPCVDNDNHPNPNMTPGYPLSVAEQRKTPSYVTTQASPMGPMMIHGDKCGSMLMNAGSSMTEMTCEGGVAKAIPVVCKSKCMESGGYGYCDASMGAVK